MGLRRSSTYRLSYASFIHFSIVATTTSISRTWNIHIFNVESSPLAVLRIRTMLWSPCDLRDFSRNHILAFVKQPLTNYGLQYDVVPGVFYANTSSRFQIHDVLPRSTYYESFPHPWIDLGYMYLNSTCTSPLPIKRQILIGNIDFLHHTSQIKLAATLRNTPLNTPSN